jgi:hypothetical protein
MNNSKVSPSYTMEDTLISDITERIRTLRLDEEFTDQGWTSDLKLSEPLQETSVPIPLPPSTGEYVFQDVEHVYIVQEREFISRKLHIYKIGMTTREAQDRFKAYSKSTKILLCMHVNDSKAVEDMLVEAFKTRFIQRTDIGRESFEGNLLEMTKFFTSLVLQYYETPRGDPSAPPLERKAPIPLTLDLIRKTIPLYNFKMIKNGKEGFKEFILLLITTPDGPNMKCVNKEKLIFSRLSGIDKGKEKWVKDGKKFIVNVFTEVGEDGKSLLRRVKECWLEVKDAHLRCTNSEDRERYEILLKDVETLEKTFENEKVIRSRFLKSVLVDVAADEP